MKSESNTYLTPNVVRNVKVSIQSYWEVFADKQKGAIVAPIGGLINEKPFTARICVTYDAETAMLGAEIVGGLNIANPEFHEKFIRSRDVVNAIEPKKMKEMYSELMNWVMYPDSIPTKDKRKKRKVLDIENSVITDFNPWFGWHSLDGEKPCDEYAYITFAFECKVNGEHIEGDIIIHYTPSDEYPYTFDYTNGYYFIDCSPEAKDIDIDDNEMMWHIMREKPEFVKQCKKLVKDLYDRRWKTYYDLDVEND